MSNTLKSEHAFRSIGLLLACVAAFAQTPAFEVATIKLAKSGGHSGITADPGRLSARNVSLKELIFEAYQVQYSQILGGPAWLGTDMYDVDAKSEQPVARDQLRVMLRGLLSDRFKLSAHTDKKEMRVYTLQVIPGTSKLHPALENATRPAPGVQRFHGELSQFAGLLAVQLTIPMSNDPTTPSRATGPIVPVLDHTGLAGVYDIDVNPFSDPSTDTFTAWQRALRDKYGLRLEAQKQPVDVLIVDRAAKPSISN
jgi:uncharacterized protein (TIGR03435 family)